MYKSTSVSIVEMICNPFLRVSTVYAMKTDAQEHFCRTAWIIGNTFMFRQVKT